MCDCDKFTNNVFQKDEDTEMRTHGNIPIHSARAYTYENKKSNSCIILYIFLHQLLTIKFRYQLKLNKTHVINV